MTHWLDGTAAEAAALLARTEQAGRRARQKRAWSPDVAGAAQSAWDAVRGAAGQGLDWVKARAPEAQAWAGQHPIPAGLLGGAALGGLGGLALGATGKRRKSPWATALTGALAGTALGGGAGALYQGLNAPGLPPATLDAMNRKVHADSGVIDQTAAILGGTAPPDASLWNTGAQAFGAATRGIQGWFGADTPVQPAAALPPPVPPPLSATLDAATGLPVTGTLGLLNATLGLRHDRAAGLAHRYQAGRDALVAKGSDPIAKATVENLAGVDQALATRRANPYVRLPFMPVAPGPPGFVPAGQRLGPTTSAATTTATTADTGRPGRAGTTTSTLAAGRLPRRGSEGAPFPGAIDTTSLGGDLSLAARAGPPRAAGEPARAVPDLAAHMLGGTAMAAPAAVLPGGVTDTGYLARGAPDGLANFTAHARGTPPDLHAPEAPSPFRPNPLERLMGRSPSLGNLWHGGMRQVGVGQELERLHAQRTPEGLAEYPEIETALHEGRGAKGGPHPIRNFAGRLIAPIAIGQALRRAPAMSGWFNYGYNPQVDLNTIE